MAKTQPRFRNSDFSDGFVEPWELTHRDYANGFSCARSEFRSHFKSRIPRDVEKHLGRCWLIAEDRKLVGYITLLADRLQVSGGKSAQQVLKSEGVKYTSFPAVKIGILATDRRTTGAGKALTLWALNYVAKELSPRMGVRFVTVDALYDVDVTPHYDISGFYTKLGFRYADPEQRLPPKNGIRTMYFDLKEILDAISKGS